ncbi:MAG: Ig-like domain-containing protein, partial [Bacteroidota bacterium]
CTASTDDVIVTFQQNPTTAAAGNDQNLICTATTATLSANTPTNGTGVWTLVSGTGNITNPNSATTTVTGLTSGVNTFSWTISFGICPSSTDQVNLNVVCSNLPPVANNDNVNVAEDSGPNTISPLNNDTDPNAGDILTITIFNGPNHGTASTNGTTITYTPNANYNGPDTITYVVCDNGIPSYCDTGLVIINVTPVNDPPVATNDVITVNEDSGPNTITVQNNDVDPDGNSLTTTILSGPNHGSATTNGTNITYTPNNNYNGPDTITYVICDNGTPTLCDTAIVVINVTPVNDPPVAVNDQTTLNEDSGPVTINVQSNDSDPEGNSLTTTILSGPNHGTATTNGNSISYNPTTNYNGPDTITYVICDNGTPTLCDTAIVVINVTPVNDPPVATNDVITVNEDSGPNTITVQNNDVDPDGNTLTTTILSGPNHGNATTNGTDITYTPNNNYNGPDTITYVICDNGTPTLCDTAIVVINVTPVNDPPVAVNDQTTLNEDSGPVTINVQSNDSDPEGNTLTTTILSGPNHGTANTNGNSISYNPTTNYNGLDTITYVICDNGTPSLCDTAIVVINVTPVNDPPNANTDIDSTSEETPVVIDVQNNDTDVDGDTLTTTIVSGANHGTIQILNGDSIIYTPNTNYTGNDTIIYQVCDNGVPALCDIDTVIITVVNANDPPVALNDYSTTDPGVADTVSVLNNDLDPDGNSLTVTILNQPTNGTATVLPNGQIVYNNNPSFINGIDTITYVICDNGFPSLCDTAIVVIWVPENSLPPIAVDDNASTNEDSPITVNVLFNDADPNIPGDTLTVSIVSNPQNGTVVVNPDGTVTYTPNPNFNGSDSFTYAICDTSNFCDTAVVYINVTPVNDPPDAVTDNASTGINTSVTVDVQQNDSDIDGNTLTTSIVTLPANGTVQIINGDSIVYTPNNNYIGPDYFLYQICDNGIPTLCDIDTVFININPTNVPPSVNDTNVVTPINTPITVCTTISDPDAGSAFNANVCGVSNGTATASVNGNQLCVTYTPNNNYAGPDSICIIVCDNGVPSLCDTVQIGVIVTSPPSVNDTNVTTPINTPVTVCTTISDPDTGSVFSSSICGVSNGTATASINGNQLCVTYTPNNNFTGPDSICVIVCDNGNPSQCDTVQIGVIVTGPPSVPDTNVTTPINTPITVCSTITDPDPGSVFSANICGVANGTATASVNGNQLCVTYTPNNNYTGPDSICVIVCDNGNPSQCDTVHIGVTVTGTNTPPDVTDTTITTIEDSVITVCTTISDANAGSVFGASLCGVSNGTASLSVSGNQLCVIYTPNPNFNGLDSICIIVCDNGTPTLCDTIIIPVIVTPVNDPPDLTGNNGTTPQGTPVTVCSTVTDLDSNTVFSASICGTTNGTASVTVNGTQVCITYTPTPDFTGVTQICVEACDNGNPQLCDTAIFNVTVTPRDEFFVPEGISPNGDNQNDNFVIKGLEKYPNNKILIFNRWGDKVYDAAPYNNDWNGINKYGLKIGGEELPTGTYFYIIDLGVEGKDVIKGYIYLSR